jgi:hypothetical protein
MVAFGPRNLNFEDGKTTNHLYLSDVDGIEKIKQGIQIKHSDLDRFGGLSKSST